MTSTPASATDGWEHSDECSAISLHVYPNGPCDCGLEDRLRARVAKLEDAAVSVLAWSHVKNEGGQVYCRACSSIEARRVSFVCKPGCPVDALRVAVAAGLNPGPDAL